MFELRTSYRFCAAHSIDGLPKGHKCGRLHGHNYVVTIICRGIKLEDTGFLIDAALVDEIVKPIVDRFDHQTLDDFLTPTSEMLARYIARMVGEDKRVAGLLWAVDVKETDKITARFYVR